MPTSWTYIPKKIAEKFNITMTRTQHKQNIIIMISYPDRHYYYDCDRDLNMNIIPSNTQFFIDYYNSYYKTNFTLEEIQKSLILL